MLISIARSDIEEIEPLVHGAVEGLVGAGTNTFPSETVQEAYISYMTDCFVEDIARIRKFVKYNNAPAYEAITEKLVDDAKKTASSSNPDELFENIRRNVEYNPEEKEQIIADMDQLAVALKIRGRNFEKKYATSPLFSATCNYIMNVYANYVKANRLNRELVNYVKYYMNRMEEASKAEVA